MKKIQIRKWLNPKGSPSSGSVFAYAGEPIWKTKSKEKMMILEIADCHGKVRLHKSDKESKKAFVKKMKKLRSVIDEFITKLS